MSGREPSVRRWLFARGRLPSKIALHTLIKSMTESRNHALGAFPSGPRCDCQTLRARQALLASAEASPHSSIPLGDRRHTNAIASLSCRRHNGSDDESYMGRRLSTTPANDPNAYRGLWHGPKAVTRTEGFRGLYRGTSLALFGVSNGALQFMAYEEMKKWGFLQQRKLAPSRVSNTTK